MSVWVGDKKIVLQKPIQNFFKFIKKRKKNGGRRVGTKKCFSKKPMQNNVVQSVKCLHKFRANYQKQTFEFKK